MEGELLVLHGQRDYFEKHVEYRNHVLPELRCDPVVVSYQTRLEWIQRRQAHLKIRQQIQACQQAMKSRALRTELLEWIRDVLLSIHSKSMGILISGDLLRSLVHENSDLLEKYHLILRTSDEMCYSWEMDHTINHHGRVEWTMRHGCEPLFHKGGLTDQKEKISMSGISNQYVLKTMDLDRDLVSTIEIEPNTRYVGFFQRSGVGILLSQTKWEAAKLNKKKTMNVCIQE